MRNKITDVTDYLKPKSKDELDKIFNSFKEHGEVNVYKEIIGKILKDVDVNKKIDEIYFSFSDDTSYIMFHEQDCCENVLINDICGDLNDLINCPLLIAEEIIYRNPNASESETWTFYKFATIKGYVDIRWVGSSNGYYSETVTFRKNGN